MCASADDQVDEGCGTAQGQSESTCNSEKEFDDLIGISLPEPTDSSISASMAEKVAMPRSHSACRFAGEGMGIFHTAGDVYDETTIQRGADSLDKELKNIWYVLLWRGVPEDAQLTVHELSPDASGSAFVAAGELIRSDSQQTLAYALVWKDDLVNDDTGLTSEVLRVNAGFNDGRAYDVYMPAERTRYEFTELGCGVNLLNQ